MTCGDENGEVPSDLIADLHCHYPMHVVAQAKGPYFGLKDKARGFAMRVAARAANHPSFFGDWRVSFSGLQEGKVRLVLSVLLSPFGELDLEDLFQPDPEHSYYDALVKQLDAVEDVLEKKHGDSHIIVRNEADLKRVLRGERIGICHAVEGGFHLGRDPDAVEARVAELARRGVAYITLAHLIPHRVAANAPALPFLPDHVYDRLFPQRTEGGLTDVGEAAVRAMHAHGVLIDLSHMHEDAIESTLAILKELDKETHLAPTAFPVIATHAGYRFGSQHYMLAPKTIRGIARRDGVIGVIMAQHQLNDGRHVLDPDSTDESLETVFAHIDALSRQAEGRDHVAIGSDLDGFINPTIAGIEKIENLALLREPLIARYGAADAKGILAGNAVRVLKKAYARRD